MKSEQNLMHRCSILCATLLVPLAWGCDRQTEPPPLYVGQGGDGLLPVSIPDMSADRGLLAAATGGDTQRAARDAGGAAAAPAIQVDDSTPEGIVDGYIHVIAAGSFQQLPELLVPEQQEKARQVLGILGPLMDASQELKRAVDERFPGHAIQLGQGMDELAGFAEAVHVIDIQVITDDQAEATLGIEATGEQEHLKLERIDGRWRVRDPRIDQTPDEGLDQMAAMMSGMADGMRQVAARVQSGEIADEEALGAAMMEMLAGVMGRLMGMEGQMQPFPAEPPAGTEAAPPPPQQQREAVDEVYSGPGMLRGR
jgi:hypothetical protein